MKYIPELGVSCSMYNPKYGTLNILVVATGKYGLLAEVVAFGGRSEIHLEYANTLFYPNKTKAYEQMREDIESISTPDLAVSLVEMGWIKPKPLTAPVLQELVRQGALPMDLKVLADMINSYIRGELKL